MEHIGSMNRRAFLRRAGMTGALAATGGLGGVLAGCGRGETGESAAEADQPVSGGELSLATIDTPVNMDPADAELYASMQVYQNVFHKLINVDQDFNFVPGLAAEWTQDDERTWTLDLVDNAVFHNDEPLTAEDVKFTFDRLPEHPNGIFVSAWEETEVLDTHRVRFHLSRPFGPFEATLAAISDIVNQRGVEEADPRLEPVGCGPFRMERWVRDDRIVLERWDKFFKPELPYLDTVTFRAIADDSVRLTGLETGELDWIQRVPLQRASELEGAENLLSSPGQPYLPDLILLNCTKPPFNDPRVRQAIAWLVNRDEIADIVWFGTAVPATEAVSPPNPWHTGINPYDGGPDVDRAMALLREAGQQGLQLTFAGQPQVPTQVRMGEVLQSQLAEAGIEMRIENYEPAQWFEQLATKAYDLTITYWSATIDPAHFYLPVCRSDSPWNFSGVQSQRIDDAVEAFAFTTDQAERESAYADVVEAVADEAPVIFLVNEKQQYWTAPGARGPAPLPSLEIRLEDSWRTS